MKKNTSKKKTQEEGKQGFASYIGIDLGDKSSDVCVLDAAGEKREKARRRGEERGEDERKSKPENTETAEIAQVGCDSFRR